MKKIFLIISVSLSVHNASAQLQLPRAFQQPIEQALERNKEIHNKQIELQKAELQSKSVKGKHLPTLDVTAGYAYFDNHMIIDLPGYKLPITGAELFSGKTTADNHGNIAHAGLLAKSVLYSGGQINNGVRALEQKAIGDALMVETDKDKLVEDIITSIDKFSYLDASEKLIEDSDKRLQKEEERVNRAIENGLAVPFDRDKIKLARLELESKKTQLAENKALLFQKLTYLTGMAESDLKKLTYDLDPIVLPEDLTIEDKQEIAALEAYKSAGEFMLQKEKGSFLPQVAAFAGLSFTGIFSGESSFHIPNLPPQISQPHVRLNQLSAAPSVIGGVILKWQLFGGNERKHKVEEANLNLMQIENKLQDSRDKLNLLLRQKMSSYRLQWKQMDLAAQQVTVARNNLTLAEKQYAQGLFSINQRLEAENDFIKAGQKQTEARMNQRQAAIEALMVTGHLSDKIQYQ